ncbi:MAG: hypothetical protein QXU98_08165 [Candidatus Parvarchaeota archaeon]
MPYNETKRKTELLDKWITIYSRHTANTRFGSKEVYTATFEGADNTKPENYFDFFGSVVLDAELDTEVLPITIRIRTARSKNGTEYYVYEKKSNA